MPFGGRGTGDCHIEESYFPKACVRYPLFIVRPDQKQTMSRMIWKKVNQELGEAPLIVVGDNEKHIHTYICTYTGYICISRDKNGKRNNRQIRFNMQKILYFNSFGKFT